MQKIFMLILSRNTMNRNIKNCWELFWLVSRLQTYQPALVTVITVQVNLEGNKTAGQESWVPGARFISWSIDWSYLGSTLIPVLRGSTVILRPSSPMVCPNITIHMSIKRAVQYNVHSLANQDA